VNLFAKKQTTGEAAYKQKEQTDQGQSAAKALEPGQAAEIVTAATPPEAATLFFRTALGQARARRHEPMHHDPRQHKT
jgi:hypothetical protein